MKTLTLNNIKLCSLRIPTGWIITYNRFLELNPGDNVEILGTTEYIGKPKKGYDIMPGYGNNPQKHRSLLLQDHGDLVSYRNIWMRKL